MRPGIRKYVKAILNVLTAVVLLLLTIYVLPKVLRFFMPFLIGWIVALIANPLVHFFEQKLRIKRKAGSAIVIVAVIGGVIFLGYLLVSKLVTECSGFVADLPVLWENTSDLVKRGGENLSGLYLRFPADLRESISQLSENLGEYISSVVNELGEPTVNTVGNIVKNIPSFIISFFMCLLSSYFFIAEKELIVDFLKKYIPDSVGEKWRIMYSSLTGAVGGYFVAQFRIECIIYVMLFIGLWLIGVEYSFLIALVIAFLDMLPVFGAGAVLWPWTVVELFAGEYKMALALMIMWGLAQLIRQLIQPKFVSDSIGLPAIPTLFLLYIGYKVGSVVGMILAVPLGLVVLNMYKAGFFETTKNSIDILINGFNRFRKLDPEDLEE